MCLKAYLSCHSGPDTVAGNKAVLAKSVQEMAYILYIIIDLTCAYSILLVCMWHIRDANLAVNAHFCLEVLLLWQVWVDHIHLLLPFHPAIGILVGHLQDILWHVRVVSVCIIRHTTALLFAAFLFQSCETHLLICQSYLHTQWNPKKQSATWKDANAAMTTQCSINIVVFPSSCFSFSPRLVLKR